MLLKKLLLKNAVLLKVTFAIAASPSKGKTSGLTAEDKREEIDHWLQWIWSRDIILDLEEIVHARVNSVFPIIYCTNNHLEEGLQRTVQSP